MPTRTALDRLRSAEKRMKTAEERLDSFIERSERQYSPQERSENKRLLDELRLAMVEYSEAFEQAVRS
jgi:DNA-directed RNA polymerase specialized sigma24 family protein